MVIISKIVDYITENLISGEVHFSETLFGCKNCGYCGRLHRHGCYTRLVLTLFLCREIRIQRFKCPIKSCGKTYSKLPCYLIPYFRYSYGVILCSLYFLFVLGNSTRFIVNILHCINPECYISRQSLRYFRVRFMSYMSLVNIFFASYSEFYYDMDIKAMHPNAAACSLVLKIFRFDHTAGSFNLAYHVSMPNAPKKYFFALR